MDKSIEQAAESYSREIFKTRNKILDDFGTAYAAQLSHMENIDLQDICLVEQIKVQSFRDPSGPLCTKYWFEYKPRFIDEE